MRGGLALRTIVASGLLAVLVGGAFAVLVRAITEERDSAALATHSQEVIGTASGLERMVLDLETGQRGYLITRDDRFLEPWRAALEDYQAESRDLIRLAVVPAQDRGARRIAAAVESYVRDYSVPLVEAAGRGDPSASSARSLAEGRERVNEIRGLFDRFVAAERALFRVRDERADTDARNAIAAAAVGLAASILLIALFGGYLTRAIAIPVRRAASMAGRLAGGDLATRMPETGVGEIGALERSFNTMAGSLEESRDELRRRADEQAALRRVATLVARGVPASELFEAVAAEVQGLLGADVTRLVRYEPDGTATALSRRAATSVDTGEEYQFTLDGESVTAIVWRTGRHARKDSYDETDSGAVPKLVRQVGVRTAVGAPIVVEDRLWGVMTAAWQRTEALPADAEQRIAQFTELIATAIANAQSRAELAASRARVVATADETRRRIERDLHDGAQQQLVHTVITLKLAKRALGDREDPATGLVNEALGHAERATAELRDLAHGILPPSLSRGLLGGIESLVSRVRLPVSIDVTEERLPQALEATAYFIVAEALTNVVKHAGAGTARISAHVHDGALRVEVHDDGAGGAHVDGSSGLLGLHDRAAALSGELTVESPPGSGTTIVATLPVPGA